MSGIVGIAIEQDTRRNVSKNDQLFTVVFTGLKIGKRILSLGIILCFLALDVIDSPISVQMIHESYLAEYTVVRGEFVYENLYFSIFFCNNVEKFFKTAFTDTLMRHDRGWMNDQ
jgi:hypothetical protein